MPLWDNFGDQISKLPTIAAIAADTDRLLHLRSGFTGGFSATLLNVPYALVWMFNASGVGASPTASTTEKDSFAAPYGLTVGEVVVTISVAQASGTVPGFDLFNITDSLSVLDNTATADSVLTVTNSQTTATDSAPDRPSVASPETIGFYCRQAPTNNVGSTWGHMIFWG